jgi:hypothetical protein
MKVIIAGGRNISNIGFLIEAIDQSGFEITEVICGLAAGADILGKEWAENNGIPVKEFPAEWDRIDVPGAIVKYRSGKSYNARAGHDRNAKMAEYADALIALWDGRSPGTKGMIKEADKRKLSIFIYRIDKLLDKISEDLF